VVPLLVDFRHACQDKAAVHPQGNAGDVGGLIGGKKGYRPADIFRKARTLQGDIPAQFIPKVGL
jgi:hypothetical protein